MILIFFSSATSVFSQDGSEEEREKEELRVEYITHLTEEGFRPEIDSDGDVKLMREGKKYYIMVRSPRLFWISRELSKEDACEQKFLLALDKVCRSYWNVTTAVYKACDGVSFSSRSWVSNADDWKDIIMKSMDSVDNAIESSYDYYE